MPRLSDWRLGRWTAKAVVGGWLSLEPERVEILVDQRTFSIESVDGLTVLATAATAIGAAMLVSTGISYLMSKRMGLLSRPSARRDLDTSRSA